MYQEKRFAWHPSCCTQLCSDPSILHQSITPTMDGAPDGNRTCNCPFIPLRLSPPKNFVRGLDFPLAMISVEVVGRIRQVSTHFPNHTGTLLGIASFCNRGFTEFECIHAVPFDDGCPNFRRGPLYPFNYGDTWLNILSLFHARNRFDVYCCKFATIWSCREILLT